MRAIRNELTRRRGNLRLNIQKLRLCGRENCTTGNLKPCWLFPEKKRHKGVRITGPLRSEIGLGRSTRLLVKSAQEASIPFALKNILIRNRQHEAELLDTFESNYPMRADIFVTGLLNIKNSALSNCRSMHNIIYPFWELDRVSKKELPYLEMYSAIWAPSQFIFDILASAQNRPLHLVPQPVELPEQFCEPVTPTKTLKLLTFFDFISQTARKNPMASIAAFKAAFPKKTEDVKFTIKMHGRSRGNQRKVIYEASKDDPRIELVDKTITRHEMNEMVRNCDVFLSLHRSEGFGFGCAEALAAGKAVIATDYSGTKDFINENTGYPVSYKMINVKNKDYYSKVRGQWADPSIEHAASILKKLYEDPSSIEAKSKAGYELLRKRHSTQVIGRRMRALLEADGVL